jgi:hypothetical protein
MSPPNPASNDHKSKNSICFHWSEGACHHGADCWFRHEYAPGEEPRQVSRDISMKERLETKSHIPARRSEGSRYIDMKDANEIARTVKHSKPSVIFDPMKTNDSLAISQSELPSSPAKMNSAAQPTPKASELSARLPTASSDDRVAASKTEPTLKEHRRKKALREPGSRAKEVTFGLDETQISFAGLWRHESSAPVALGTLIFQCQQGSI